MKSAFLDIRVKYSLFLSSICVEYNFPSFYLVCGYLYLWFVFLQGAYIGSFVFLFFLCFGGASDWTQGLWMLIKHSTDWTIAPAPGPCFLIHHSGLSFNWRIETIYIHHYYSEVCITSCQFDLFLMFVLILILIYVSSLLMRFLLSEFFWLFFIFCM